VQQLQAATEEGSEAQWCGGRSVDRHSLDGATPAAPPRYTTTHPFRANCCWLFFSSVYTTISAFFVVEAAPTVYTQWQYNGLLLLNCYSFTAPVVLPVMRSDF